MGTKQRSARLLRTREKAAANVAQGSTEVCDPKSFVAASSLKEPRSPWMATRNRFTDSSPLGNGLPP